MSSCLTIEPRTPLALERERKKFFAGVLPEGASNQDLDRLDQCKIIRFIYRLCMR